MKNLISIIEKLKIGSKTQIPSEGINLLVELLIKIVLSKQKTIKKSDFEYFQDNIYTLYNVPQNKKYWKAFYEEIIFKYNQDFKVAGHPVDKTLNDDYFRVKLIDDKNTNIMFNLTNSKELNSIDVTENIMKLILDKIK